MPLDQPSRATDTNRFAYHGGSMSGMFREGDCLLINRAPFTELEPGDIVAYKKDKKTISHRIIKQTAFGWITQGDGNISPDVFPVTKDRYIGRATAFEREGVCYPVVGGKEGLIQAHYLHARAYLSYVVRKMLIPPYRFLKMLNLVPLFWRPCVMQLKLGTSESDSYTKYIVKGKTIACWRPAEKHWVCRKPYDLILTSPSKRP